MGNIYPGKSIVMPKSSGETPHLWVVVTEPEGTPPEAVIVNLTSRKPDSDTTVVLNVGDHPFITHETIVFYADATLAKTDGIEALSRFRGYGYHDDFDPEVLERIKQGLIDSRNTPKDIKAYCRARFTSDQAHQAAAIPPISS